MVTAIITGASSGLGREYAMALKKKYPSIESFWLIARRRDKLEDLAQTLGKDKCFVLPLDLTNPDDLKEYVNSLKDICPEVAYLVNNAGFGKLGDFDSLDPQIGAAQVNLNCSALTFITGATLPYMNEGSEIINIASIASFAPNPRMAVYCSTKAYVMSFSRALREELKKRKINVLAVCPGPMDTEFLPTADILPGSSHTFDTLPKVNAKVVARKSLIASKKKRAVYTNRIFYKFYRVLAKLLPKSIIMKFSKT